MLVTIIYLVRHGKASAAVGGADPELDSTGREQAAAVATALAPLGPLVVLSSPQVRARETAAVIAERWNVATMVEPRIGDVPWPTENVRERTEWLGTAFAGGLENLPRQLREWRRDMLDYIAGRTEDCVAVSHFSAINVIVGAATRSDAIISCHPHHGSVTRIGVDRERLRLIELGTQIG